MVGRWLFLEREAAKYVVELRSIHLDVRFFRCQQPNAADKQQLHRKRQERNRFVDHFSGEKQEHSIVCAVRWCASIRRAHYGSQFAVAEPVCEKTRSRHSWYRPE